MESESEPWGQSHRVRAIVRAIYGVRTINSKAVESEPQIQNHGVRAIEFKPYSQSDWVNV